MKLLPMTTDDRHGARLNGKLSSPPHPPGESISIESSFSNSMAFVALKIGPDDRFKVMTPTGMREQGNDAVAIWRIDEIKIDDIAIEHTSVLRVAAKINGDDSAVRGAFGVGTRVSMRATNVGTTVGYFYATWELEDVH